MFKIFVKHGQTTVIRENFSNPFEAEARFGELITERVDGAGGVYLAQNNIIHKEFRIDMNWPGERYLQNKPTV